MSNTVGGAALMIPARWQLGWPDRLAHASPIYRRMYLRRSPAEPSTHREAHGDRLGGRRHQSGHHLGALGQLDTLGFELVTRHHQISL